MNSLIGFLYSVRTFILSKLKIKTSGVRVVLEKEGKVLLVKHRYHPCWSLPGGGIKKGESKQEAGKREVSEECGIIVDGFANNLGEYFSTQEGRDDTVTVLVARLWSDRGKRPWSFEIKKCSFFDIHSLPEDASVATKKRIDEYLSGKRNFNKTW